MSAVALFGLTGCGEAAVESAVDDGPVAADFFTPESPDVPATLTVPSAPPSVVVADSEVHVGSALEVLESLKVAELASDKNYDRVGNFGAAWLDVGERGCDTRNEILARDLGSPVTDGCQVMSGVLEDPFSDTKIDFVRGKTTSGLVQISHLVSLQNAWQTGAQDLDQAQRESLANDPLNLQAVAGASAALKAANNAAGWLPENVDYQCEYVARQVSVKASYGLWVTPAEKTAMKEVLQTCPGQAVQNSPFTPAPVVPEPEVVPEYVPEIVPEAEPTVPEPAQDPVVTGINPGGFCSTPGVVGIAASGKSYTCGGKGPDASGRYHWNN